MVIEFVVNVGCTNSLGTIETLSFVLGNYVSDDSGTAYQKLANDVLELKNHRDVNWVMVGFVSLQPNNDFIPLLVMHGNLEWFASVLYFKKIVGDAGGSTATPVSCGFIDNSRNLRVELENGVVCLRAVE